MTPPQAPRITLVALTHDARTALGGPEAEITTFPYRVGRESRGMRWVDSALHRERRDPGSHPSNELYLPDREEPLNVSREHLQIERNGAGFLLVDRHSTCGTIVEGAMVGGDTRGGSAPLQDGNVIIVGGPRSPFVFKVRVRD